MYLYHLKDAHAETINIFPCDLCEYASRYKCKVLRHRKFVHRAAKPINPDDLNEDDRTDNMMENEENEETSINGSGEAEEIDGIHEMEQENYSEAEGQENAEVFQEECETTAPTVENEPTTLTIRNTVTSIRSPIKSTDNAFDYIQRISNSPDFKQAAYQCALCTYSNVQKWKVANHVRSFHMKKKVFKCPFCNFVTSRKIEFCIHKTKHSDKKVYACKECDYKSISRTNFDRHLANHDANLPVKCSICSYSSTGEAAVQRHLTECHPNMSTCTLTSVLNNNNLMMVDQSGSESESSGRSSSQEMTCKVCGMKVKNESKLRIHMVSHTSESVHWCPLCTLKYKRSSDLNRHMKRKHGAKLRDFFFMGQQEQPLNLSVQKASLAATGSGLKATLGGEDQPLDLSLPKKGSLLVPAENLKCSHCSYLAKWPSDLRRHLLVHSVEKRFKCPCCHRKYKYQFDLNMHLRRMHRVPAGRTKVPALSGSVPPVVNVATLNSSSVTVRNSEQSLVKEKAMASKSVSNRKPASGKMPKVNRYKLTRQQVSPQGKYKCDYCPYLGKYQSEVDRHMRLHTGEKPYSCLYCSYRSHWRGDMKRHLQKHHSSQKEVVEDIASLMERTYQPENTPEPDQSASVSYPEEIQIKKEPNTEDDEVLVDEHNSAETHSDKASLSDQLGTEDGMEFVTLTPQSTPSSTPSATPNKVVGDKRQNLCPYCPFSCEAPSKLKCHMEIHENLKRFKCAHCGKRSNWTWDVRKHIKKEHPNMELNVIIMEEEEARETLADYLQTHYKSPPKKESPDKNDLPTQVPLHRITDQLPPLELMNSLGNLPLSHNISETSPREAEDAPSTGNRVPGLSMLHRPGRLPSVATKRCRPFKCSKCGRRSNWKWDMNKHIRNVHPAAKLIIMTQEEARATMPKGGFKSANYKANRDNIKAKSGIVKQESPSPSKQKYNHQFDSNRTKKFKCSSCPYRSDYRSDIGRHLKRLHRKGSASILMLSDQEARATLQEYKDKWVRGKFVFSPAKERAYKEAERQSAAKRSLESVFSQQEYAPYQTLSAAPLIKKEATIKEERDPPDSEAVLLAPPLIDRGKLWKCPKCSYKNPNKKMVMRHMRNHPKVKVFQCRLCGEASDYRNSMYRHVRNKHHSTDYSGIVNESIASVSNVKSEPNMDDCNSEEIPVTYRCKLCDQTSSWKSGIMRHVADKHHGLANMENVMEVVRIEMALPPKPRPAKNTSRRRATGDQAKQLACSVCPYRTNKTGLLRIHSTYHHPQTGNKFKCKYCPYYVSAMRLLHQHVRLHLKPGEHTGNIKEEPIGEEVPDIPTTPTHGSTMSPTHVRMSPTSSNSSASPGRRYYCDQCPAVSRNKNDFLYHKQFHRPKPTAPFKCKLCNYWVSQRRLLRQHERVHLSEYIEHYHNNNNNSPKPAVLKTYADRGNSVPQMVLASPAKSDISDYCDAVQMATIKQQIIASKITSVPITPEKFSEQKSFERMQGLTTEDEYTMEGYLVNKSGQFMKSGALRKLHKCSHCPYTNIRATNLRMHGKMHGGRPGKDLLKCPYCDYHVGNKGLLSHHVKVHSSTYRPGQDEINDVELEGDEEGDENEDDEENAMGEEEEEQVEMKSDRESGEVSKDVTKECMGSAHPGPSTTPPPPKDVGAVLNLSCLPGKMEYYVKYNDSTGEHLLERARFKKWCCEKCPYATMKRSQFERHVTLHTNRQKYTCEFCDYSVPAYHLLLQHKKLHLEPNPNLLSVQSIANLQRLPQLPADVAAATNFPAETTDPASQQGIHDHLELYENTMDFTEPKKLYRCDRCPYTNVRRDHLLSHLRFHMVQSELQCPYCDYSVSKQHLLVQHVRVHFTAPGSEGFSNTTNAALNLSLNQTADGDTKLPGAEGTLDEKLDGSLQDKPQPEYIELTELTKVGAFKAASEATECKVEAKDGGEDDSAERKDSDKEDGEKAGSEENVKEKMEEEKGGKVEGVEMESPDTMWICQYCDRAFGASEILLRHEMQHLVGNQF